MQNKTDNGEDIGVLVWSVSPNVQHKAACLLF